MDEFERDVEPLVGVASTPAREVFVAQIIESQRRNRYIRRLLTEVPLTEPSRDPASGSFDPLKAAILYSRDREYDEACWLVLLSVHFGRHRRNDWQLSSDFYGRLGQPGRWDWASAIANVVDMRDWLDANRTTISARGGRFGNHRKRESLSGSSANGTGAVLSSYIEWVGASHEAHFSSIAVGPTPMERFAALYESAAQVRRFGRIARFDYLSMMGKLGLMDVEPDGLHLVGASGPQYGARLLLAGHFRGQPRNLEIERRLAPLRDRLGIGYDVFEDALCNWQKSPTSFVAFRG
ncbi:alpha-glutamyl/putrescinyl thymine pyrophosphorylase clade 3 protein [Nocardioides sediminis]|uniref:alpha-glutamyl/putrescinyl thymine pyrophosphorylase clade 3 protein n=1 Tax=Nocardioides sediminis TaxID=433648 RepID=UPI000D2F8F16|nr:hypothetical protein [Nocardioides sediminis]